MAHKEIFPFDIRKDFIPVFEVGYYPQLETNSNPFGLADDNLLRELADSYNPSVYMAPLTTDHEQFGPALGRFEGFEVRGDKLFAKVAPGSVDSDFANDLDTGKWLYPSIEIFFPSNPASPTPGRYSVKAVTWLGAGTPQIKGLFDGFSAPWEFTASDGRHVACLSQFNRKEMSIMTEKELKAKLEKAEADLKAANKKAEEAAATFKEASDKSKADLKKQKDETAKLTTKVADLSGTKTAEFKELADKNLVTEKALEALKKSIDERDATERKNSIATFCEEMKSKGFFNPAVVDEKIKPRLDRLADTPSALKEAMESYRDSSTAGKFFIEQSRPGGPGSPIVLKNEKVTPLQLKLVASFAESQVQGNPADKDSCAVAVDGFARFNEEQRLRPERDPRKRYIALREAMVEAALAAKNAQRRAA